MKISEKIRKKGVKISLQKHWADLYRPTNSIMMLKYMPRPIA